jgi:hypothetical protein
MFRATLRETAIVFVSIGVGLAWCLDHSSHIRRESELAERCQTCESRIETYRDALIKMGQVVKEKTGESVRIRVLEDVLDQ